MKTVSLDTLGGGSIEELRREIDVQKSLDHPNIVRLFEYFEDSQRHVIHIVMELCTGGALVSRMKTHRHGYGEQEARRLVSKVGCVAGRAPLLGWAPTILSGQPAHVSSPHAHGDGRTTWGQHLLRPLCAHAREDPLSTCMPVWRFKATRSRVGRWAAAVKRGGSEGDAVARSDGVASVLSLSPWP